MNLPPELRSQIYFELLTLTTKSSEPAVDGVHEHERGLTCFPAILATSKQIYDEAWDLLYSNEIEIRLSQTVDERAWPVPKTLFIQINREATTQIDDMDVRNAYRRWPHWLRNCHHIRLVR